MSLTEPSIGIRSSGCFTSHELASAQRLASNGISAGELGLTVKGVSSDAAGGIPTLDHLCFSCRLKKWNIRTPEIHAAMAAPKESHKWDNPAWESTEPRGLLNAANRNSWRLVTMAIASKPISAITNFVRLLILNSTTHFEESC